MGLASLLGIVYNGDEGLAGLTCSPITVVGVGAGAWYVCPRMRREERLIRGDYQF